MKRIDLIRWLWRTYLPALLIALTGSLVLTSFAAEPAGKHFRLHPDNPHYFEWQGKPTVLVTSGEHYGAVLNLDFD